MTRKLLVLTIAAVAVLVSSATFAQSLGTAGSFGVLAGSTVTNTGATTVNGNLGVSPGTAVTGAPVVTGTIHTGADPVAVQAKADLGVAYDAIAGAACNTPLTGMNLGGMTLTPGVYCFTSDAFLTGTLTLNFQGNPNAVFIFQIGTQLTTSPGSTVALINNGVTTCPPNVFWQTGTSAVLDTTTTFVGNILALASITLNTGAQLNGRALARNGQVSLQSNNITACALLGACPAITVNPASLPNGNPLVPYNATVSASGGSGTYTFAVTGGTLPTGLTLNPVTGVISGTPTVSNTFNFTITATDTATGCVGTRNYAVTIGAAVAPAGVPTLDFFGLAILFVLLAVAGVFVMSKLSI